MRTARHSVIRQSAIQSSINLPTAISRASLLVLCCAATLPACHSKTEQVPSTASDEWVRTYSLEKTDEITIVNRAGPIEIQGGEGAAAEVRVERIVHAGNHKTASDLLSKIEIIEEVKPGHIDVRTKGIEGILVGVSYETKYHVTVPSWANVRAQNTNGDLSVIKIAGRSIVGVTNGKLIAKELGGSVEARITNGQATVDVAEFGKDPVFVRGTNGSVWTLNMTAANGSLSSGWRTTGSPDGVSPWTGGTSVGAGR